MIVRLILLFSVNVAFPAESSTEDCELFFLFTKFYGDLCPLVQLFDCINGTSSSVELWTCMS